MARLYLTTNLKTLDQSQPLAVIEALFQELEDQNNAGTDLVSITDSDQTLPEGIRSGDVVFSLIRGELKVGVYNGVEPVYASFGTITGAITDTQHGTRGGGNLHLDATPTLSGFMSATDKIKLDFFKGDTVSTANASTTEYPSNGDWGFHNNTTAGTLVLAKNLSGVILTVPLT